VRGGGRSFLGGEGVGRVVGGGFLGGGGGSFLWGWAVITSTTVQKPTQNLPIHSTQTPYNQKHKTPKKIENSPFVANKKNPPPKKQTKCNLGGGGVWGVGCGGERGFALATPMLHATIFLFPLTFSGRVSSRRELLGDRFPSPLQPGGPSSRR